MGRVDVVGLRRSSTDVRDHDDLIAVEVKNAGTRAFLSGVGQAKAYTVMADYAFLARPADYGTKEKRAAERLGIGLLRLSRRPSPRRAWKVEVVSDATRSETDAGLREELLGGLGFGTCQGCGRVFRTDAVVLDDSVYPDAPTGPFIGVTKVLKTPGVLHKAAEQGKALAWYLNSEPDDQRKYMYNRRYLCQGCVAEVSRAIRVE